MLFFIHFFIKIIQDFIIVPINYIVNYCLSSESVNNSSYFDDNCSNNTSSFLVCVHHYVPRGIKYKKLLGNRVFDLGVDVVLKLSKYKNFKVYCYLLSCSKDNLAFYNSMYPNVTFILQKSNKYDFFSYLDFSNNDIYSNYDSVSYFNDNVDLNSDVVSFIIKSSQVVKNDNNNLSLIGLGYNTRLTQSIFKNAFSPHIQTFGFTVETSIFKKFSLKWYKILKNSYTLPLFKAAVCRLLEQGISKFVLGKGYSIAVLKAHEMHCYRRRFFYLDLLCDWSLPRDDSRLHELYPFRF